MDEKTEKPGNVELTPETYAQAARQAANDAQDALREIKRIVEEIGKARNTPAASPRLVIGASDKGHPAPEKEFTKRREVTSVSKGKCFCSAPLWAHSEDPPYGCPDTDCNEFRLAR